MFQLMIPMAMAAATGGTATAAGGMGAAGMAGLGMQIGGTYMGIMDTLRRGKEQKRQAYEAAAMKMQQSGNLAAVTGEKLHDLEKEKYYARGSARAIQAGAGAKVGTGSTITQVSQIEGAFRRKQEVIAKETGLRRGLLEREAHEYRKLGKTALKQSKRAAWAKALGQGHQIGQSQQWWG